MRQIVFLVLLVFVSGFFLKKEDTHIVRYQGSFYRFSLENKSGANDNLNTFIVFRQSSPNILYFSFIRSKFIEVYHSILDFKIADGNVFFHGRYKFIFNTTLDFNCSFPAVVSINLISGDAECVVQNSSFLVNNDLRIVQTNKKIDFIFNFENKFDSIIECSDSKNYICYTKELKYRGAHSEILNNLLECNFKNYSWDLIQQAITERLGHMPISHVFKISLCGGTDKPHEQFFSEIIIFKKNKLKMSGQEN